MVGYKYRFDIYNETEKGVVGFQELEVQNTTWNFRMNNNFKIVKNFRLNGFTMYRGANKNLQFRHKESAHVENGSWRQAEIGQRSLNTRYSDIFNTMNFTFKSEEPLPSSGSF